jgi:hypothetical protein
MIRENAPHTYAQNASAAGFLYSELKLAKLPVFQIFRPTRASNSAGESVVRSGLNPL